MTMQDMYGCEVTISHAQALNSWNQTLKGFLSHAGSTGTDLVAAIEQDPEFALAHAAKGLFFLLLGRCELDAPIRASYEAALNSDRQNPVTQRERHYITALEAWTNGQPSRAVQQMEEALKRFPHDPLAMKMSHAIRFMLGDIGGMRHSLENLMHVYKGHAAEGYFKGCYSFALEETGDYALAEKWGRQAIELSPDDAWGLHSVTHVFDMTGRAQEGLSWIADKETAWAHCNNFRYHVWWHIALMHLDLGNYDKVLELYDDYIRKDKTDDYRDISNATSVLLRLEFEGIEVGCRWQELVELAGNRTQDNCIAFADLHYMMALCKDDETGKADLLLSNMQSCAEIRHHCEFTAAIKHPGVLTAEGLEAYRDGNFSRAFDCLAKARPTLQTIGGSHAQRDIFERLAIESALRGGFFSQAGILLDERDSLRGGRDGYSQSRREALETCTNANNVIALKGAA